MQPIAIGDVLGGKYRIDRVLGTGGMGYVALATHVGFDDRVAIKFLHAELATNSDIVSRFLREGKSARKIRSEHVVSVTDLGTTPAGLPYMVMEYLEGVDVADLIRSRGPQPIEDAVELVLQACEALAEAHALGIVHRDLKPANLFVTTRRDGTPCLKVLDFGISKLLGPDSGSNALTKTSGIMGSPVYMPPEQLQSARDVDARADVWAIGVILYELLSARQPFHGDSLPQLCVAIMTQPAEPLSMLRPDVPPGLAAAIERCLAKDRAHRFSHVGDLAAAIVPFGPKRARNSAERVSRVAKAAGHVVTQLPSSDETPHMMASAVHVGPVDPHLASTTAPTSDALEATSSLPSSRRPVAIIVTVAALVLGVGGGVGVYVATRDAPNSHEPGSEKRTKGDQPASAKTTPAPTEGVSEPSAPTPGSAADAPTLSATASAKPTAPTTTLPSQPTSPKVAKPLPSTSTTAVSAVPPKTNCDPPYTIDSKGHKVPKTGCL